MSLLKPALAFTPEQYEDEENVAAVYNETVSTKTRQGAPLASYSIDRRCLNKGAYAFKDGKSKH